MIVGPVRGIAKLAAAVSAKQKSISRAVATAVTRGAMLIQGRARTRILKGPKTGRIYGTVANVTKHAEAQKSGNAAQKRKAGGKVHIASAKGQAPANETGNLARSIKVVKAVQRGNKWEAKVIADAPYAAALEFGTRGAGRSRRVVIEERPFLRPSVAESMEEIDQDIKRAVREAVAQ